MKFLKPAIYEVEDDARGSRSKWRNATQRNQFLLARSLLIKLLLTLALSPFLSFSLSLLYLLVW